MSTSNLSIEEICRVVLQKAVDEGIVHFARENFNSTESPMEMTSGDLVGVANLLADILGRQYVVKAPSAPSR